MTVGSDFYGVPCERGVGLSRVAESVEKLLNIRFEFGSDPDVGGGYCEWYIEHGRRPNIIIFGKFTGSFYDRKFLEYAPLIKVHARTRAESDEYCEKILGIPEIELVRRFDQRRRGFGSDNCQSHVAFRVYALDRETGYREQTFTAHDVSYAALMNAIRLGPDEELIRCLELTRQMAERLGVFFQDIEFSDRFDYQLDLDSIKVQS
ncbi:MAG: hypothetical protein K8S25_01415 [Alphaproteobacteria bacterium]|nr:hypothetical protein [Alphaproteobacteria bacterium]